MNWTVETEDEAAIRRLQGAIHERYQVVHPDTGLIDTAATLGAAFKIGDRFAMRKCPDGTPFTSTPYAVEVYDRMARKGRPQTWLRQPKRFCVYSMEDGDKMSLDGRWKCIAKRGLPKPSLDDLTTRLWS